MGLPRAARPGGPRAPAGAVPHAGRGSRALSTAVAPGEPPAGSTVRLCVRHEAPGPRARPAVIGGPSQGRENATLPRPEAARRRARARAQRLHAVCCTPGRTLGLSAMTGEWGWRRGARGGGLGANRLLVPTAASLVTPGHLQMCWVLASCPAHPAPAPSRRRPKGASLSRAVPLGSERKPVSWRNAHGCHQGSPGPQRAAGWTLAAPSGGGSRQPQRCGRWSGSSRSTLLRSSGQLSRGRGRLGRPGVAAARQEPQVPGPRA